MLNEINPPITFNLIKAPRRVAAAAGCCRLNMSSGSSNDASSVHDYFGSIAGLISCGPLDFISGVVVDDALVWPDAPEWPASNRYVHSKKIQAGLTSFYLQTQEPHGLRVGDQAALWNFPLPEMNAAPATVSAVYDAWAVSFALPISVAGDLTPYADGFISRVQPLAIGNLRRIGTTVYQCILAHAATPETRPPNTTHWKQFRLARTDFDPTHPLHLAEDPTTPATPPLVKLTLESHGELFLYWGTDTQTLDATLENILAPLGHPPYRGQAVAVLKNFFFGRERATPPNVQVIAGRNPVQSIVTGPAAALDPEGQANPMTILAELLTHPVWGLNLSPSQIDTVSWQATADWLYTTATPALTYLSPLLDRQTGVRQLISELLAHADLWLRWNAAGLLEAGHWPHNSAPPVWTSSNTVDADHAVVGADFQWASDLWNGTTNRTTLKYQDAAHAFKERPVVVSSVWNRRVTGQVQDRSIDRPHVTRAPQALALATLDARFQAEPSLSGPLKVRAETIHLAPGDSFLLSQPALGLAMPCRVTEATLDAPPAQTISLQFETERGLAALPVGADSRAGNSPGAGGAPTPRPAPLRAFALVQLPPPLAGGRDFALAFVGGRTSPALSRVDVWFLQGGASSFYELGTIRSFAVPALLTAVLPRFQDLAGNPVDEDDTQALALAIDDWTPPADLDAILSPQSPDAINDNALLCFLVAADDPRRVEIATVRSLTLTGPGTCAVRLRRARFNTRQGGNGASGWAAGDSAFLMPRGAVVPLGHARLSTLAAQGASATFRLVASTAWAAGDIDAVYNPAAGVYSGDTVEVTLPLGDAYAPQVPQDLYAPRVLSVAIIVASAGGVTLGPGPYSPTDSFQLAAVYSSLDTNLADVVVAINDGTTDRTVCVLTLPAVKVTSLITCPPFSIAAAGTYQVAILPRDALGRRARQLATDSGNQPLLIHIVSGTPAAVSPPVISPPTGNYGTGNVLITITCPTPGAVIEWYDFVAFQANPTTDPWHPYTGPFNYRALGSQIVARAKLTSGSTTIISSLVYANYGY